MRPLKLVISGFGPYADRQEIDLEKFGNQGLYLVTGDTGAGKTTIFDAISFVLYGEASGENRDSSMLRSKYAKEDTPTFVEMDFMYQDKVYHIKRNPEYMRPSKRGTGMTKHAADAVLEFPDSRAPITKSKEVTKAVIRLIGLDYNQFSQIAMIAQGDFMKLLVTKTEDRSKIFRRIFYTEPYKNLQEKIKDSSKELENCYKQKKESVEQYIDGVMCEESNVLYLALEKIKEEKSGISDALELIEKIIHSDREKNHNTLNKMEALDKEISEVDKTLGKAQTAQRAKRSLELANKLLEENRLRLKIFKEELMMQEGREGERKDLEYKINFIKEKIPEYDLLSKLTEESALEKQKLVHYKKKLQESKEQIELLSGRLEKLNMRNDQLKNVQAEEIKNRTEISNSRKEYGTYEDILESFTDYESQLLLLKKSQEEYKKAVAVWESEKSVYEHMEKMFLNQQAGILAKELEEGRPCPVCGSTNHPSLAQLSEESVSKEVLDQKKKENAEIEKKVNDLSLLAGTRNGNVNAIHESLKKQLERIDKKLNINNGRKEVHNKLSEVEKKLHLLEDEKEEIDNNLIEKKDIEKQIPYIEMNVKEQKSKEMELSEIISNQAVKVEKLVTRLEELSKGLDFETKKQAEEELKNLKNKVEQMNKDYDSAYRQYQECNQKVEEAKTTIRTLKEQLIHSESYDIENLENRRVDLETEKNELKKENNSINIRISTNENIQRLVTKIYKELKDTEEKWIWMKALSDTVSGNISGKSKIMLETYIQMTYFDRIIRHANLRLMKMTNGQYELKRREEAENQKSQSGLELDVIDHYNGSIRSVKSLSGGEAFEASLSLALGLSDEIQSYSGGIQLDTLFVDEGFGSLDEDAINHAIDALNTITEGNKLVGIISHVAELKNRIDKKLIVTKDREKGSKVEIEV